MKYLNPHTIFDWSITLPVLFHAALAAWNSEIVTGSKCTFGKESFVLWFLLFFSSCFSPFPFTVYSNDANEQANTIPTPSYVTLGTKKKFNLSWDSLNCIMCTHFCPLDGPRFREETSWPVWPTMLPILPCGWDKIGAIFMKIFCNFKKCPPCQTFFRCCFERGWRCLCIDLIWPQWCEL